MLFYITIYLVIGVLAFVSFFALQRPCKVLLRDIVVGLPIIVLLWPIAIIAFAYVCEYVENSGIMDKELFTLEKK